MDYAKEALRLHYEWKGKLEITPAPVSAIRSLSPWPTPRRRTALPGNSERCQQKL